MILIPISRSSLNTEFSNLKVTDCQQRSLSFYSEHLHDISGLNYKVRHMPICLHHEPRDKAARVKAARKRKKQD